MKTLIAITGPTASGKSDLAVDLARILKTEIISADSRQIYKDIPIVTAAPTVDEMKGVRHHLIGILPLEAYFSASMFEQRALEICDEIWKKNDVAIVCGGSMMYVDALCNGIDPIPTVSSDIRLQLTADWKKNGDQWLLDELERVDPVHFDKVDRNNMKRVFHAVEVSLTAGRPYSEFLTDTRVERPFRIIKIVLDCDRQWLFDRINRRVLLMLDAGLEEEARRVYPLRHLNSLNTVGLKELFSYFDGTWDMETAIARIQKNTRVYAKKQETWYKKDTSATRLNPLDAELRTKILNML